MSTKVAEALSPDKTTGDERSLSADMLSNSDHVSNSLNTVQPVHVTHGDIRDIVVEIVLPGSGEDSVRVQPNFGQSNARMCMNVQYFEPKARSDGISTARRPQTDSVTKGTATGTAATPTQHTSPIDPPGRERTLPRLVNRRSDMLKQFCKGFVSNPFTRWSAGQWLVLVTLASAYYIAVIITAAYDPSSSFTEQNKLDPWVLYGSILSAYMMLFRAFVPPTKSPKGPGSDKQDHVASHHLGI